jgi:hypothetical protein
LRRRADAQRWRHLGDSTLVRTASLAGKEDKTRPPPSNACNGTGIKEE